MANAPKLSVDLEARITQFEKQLAKANRAANDNMRSIENRGKQMSVRLETQMASSAAKIGDLGKSLAGALGAGALLGGLATLPDTIREVVRNLGDLADTADKIGLPTEYLQAFHYGAQLAGVDAANLDDALTKFGKTVGEAAAKGNDFSKVLEQNGVALKSADGSIRPIKELLADYANLIKNAGSESEQLLLATLAFGRGGADMVNVLRDGADGLDRIQQSARDAGVVLSNDLVRAAADVDDAFDKLSMQMKATLEGEVVRGIQTVENLISRFEALPGAIEGAWSSFERFWNKVAGISPADDAANKLRAAITMAQVNGTKPWENGFSVGDLDFGGAASKGDRVGTTPSTTKVDLSPTKKSSADTEAKRAAERAARQLDRAIAEQTGVAVDVVTTYLGENEHKNRGDINSFLKAGGVDLDAATTAWCAGFVNSALAQVGIKGTGSNLATSFLNFGKNVDANKVQRGDILVDSNGKSAGQTGGHVGFATGQTRFVQGALQLEMISGNSADSVAKTWVNAYDIVARRATDATQLQSGALDNLTEAHKQAAQEMADAYRQFNEASKEVVGGFIRDLISGKSAAEALSNAVADLADRLLDAGLDKLFGGAGGGLFGAIGSLFGFASGGYTGSGGVNQPAGIVHKGEVVWSQDDIKRAGGVGAVEALRMGKVASTAPRAIPSGGGGNMHITVGVSADSNGNLKPFVESVTRDGIRQAAPSIVQASVQQGQKATRQGLPGMLAEAQARRL